MIDFLKKEWDTYFSSHITWRLKKYHPSRRGYQNVKVHMAGTLNHWKNLSRSGNPASFLNQCILFMELHLYIRSNVFLSCYLSRKVFKFANLHQRRTAPKSSSNMSSWKSFLTTYWLDHKSGVASSSVANFCLLTVKWGHWWINVNLCNLIHTL